jgi:segregation and condensation protein B
MNHFDKIRLLEALLFASPHPVSTKDLERHLPEGSDTKALLQELMDLYANRGVNLIRIEKSWAFRTAADLAESLKIEKTVRRKLSRAATEALSIIAYHQPVTRAEIEEIRGVQISKGTIDALLELGWIEPRGRRQIPGRPLTWGTTTGFLDHFGLESFKDLPGVDELRAAGLLDSRVSLASEAMGVSDMEVDQKGPLDSEEDEAGVGVNTSVDHIEAADSISAEDSHDN